jgi:hypothetical protein
MVFIDYSAIELEISNLEISKLEINHADGTSDRA